MTALRQAAEMALEALGKTMRVWGGTCAWHNDVEKAIAALKEALAEPEPEPEQEPVAWRVLFTISGRDELYFCKPSAERRVEVQSDAVLQPLYLHPAPIPEGWQLVPKEPTESVILAGCEIDLEEETPEHYHAFVAEMYRAMLDATPEYKP